MARLISQPKCTIIELGTSYDSLDVDSLDAVGGLLLTQAATAEPPRIIVDFSQTTFIGSTFIELLVRAWRRVSQRGGTLATCGLHPFCAEVLRVTRLETLWPSYATREEAVQAIATC
jgi:anti-sigma B factor antagonist